MNRNRNHQRVRKALGSKQAFIFGPFIGEFYWEAYRFAPYAISLKKRFPKHHMIVFTRPSSFDLYGKYADILIPLKIEKGMYVEQKFKLKAYPLSEYKYLCRYIKRSYMNFFEITDHVVPRIEGFMWKVKWQFPRAYMDYEFQPRKSNKVVVDKFYKEVDNIVLTSKKNVELENYNVINMVDFLKNVGQYFGTRVSYSGCLIEILKRCEFVISDFSNILAKFSVLMDKPVITVKEKFSDDGIYLMNPHNTSIIRCDEYEKGVKEYEGYSV